MSTPSGPRSPDQPGGTGDPTQPPGMPQFFPPGQGQPQGYQGSPQGYAENMNVPPQGPVTQGWPGPPLYAAGYPPQGPEQFPKKSRTGLWVGIGVVVVAVAVVLALVLPRFFSGGGTSPDETASPSEVPTSEEPTSEEPTDPEGIAKNVAKKYLTAISEGRAEDAKRLLDRIAGDASSLTSEVLKDSLTRAPITDIKIGEPAAEEDGRYDVSVTYKVGDISASDNYKVNPKNGKLATGLPSLNFHPLKRSDITVNGEVIKGSANILKVFPGSYVVASTNKYLEIDENTVVLTNSRDKVPSSSLKPKASQAGIDLFREKVVSEAKACLASKAIDPGCGIAIKSKRVTVVEGSVTRTQNSENTSKLENVIPKPGLLVGTILSSYELGSIDITATCTTSSGTRDCILSSRFPEASLNVAEEDPKVVWKE